MSRWLDDAARGLAEGSHNRREVLLRGGAIAASTLLGSAVSPLRASATSGCTPANCPNGLCCEGRCLTGSLFGCCHDRIYSRLSKHCCPQAPAGGTHTCLDGEECCGKAKCCTSNEVCCDGKCLKGNRKRLGCCNNATYDPSIEQCCLEQPSGKFEFHVCAKDEQCCGKDKCCTSKEVCCDGKCLKGNRKRLGCCNNATYDPSIEQCCLEQPPGKFEFHVCAKDEECCGEKACCSKGQECCGAGASARCVAKGTCRAGLHEAGVPAELHPLRSHLLRRKQSRLLQSPPGADLLRRRTGLLRRQEQPMRHARTSRRLAPEQLRRSAGRGSGMLPGRAGRHVRTQPGGEPSRMPGRQPWLCLLGRQLLSGPRVLRHQRQLLESLSLTSGPRQQIPHQAGSALLVAHTGNAMRPR